MTVYLMSVTEAKKIGKKFCIENFPIRYEKAMRKKNKNDAMLSVASGTLISSVLKISEADIKLNEHGKPYTDAQKIHFSISHSGEYAAAAVSNGEIGIDIELVKKRNYKLAKKICTADEYKWLSKDYEAGFFRLWTLKESVLKAAGTGFSASPKNFSLMPYLMNGERINAGNMNLYAKSMYYGGYCISAVCEDEFSKLDIVRIGYDLQSGKIITDKT